MLPPPSPLWPTLRSFAADQLACIALPLGGIGTGTVSLGGRGQLCDWEVMNRANKGSLPGVGACQGQAAVLLRTRTVNGQVQMRCCESALTPPFYGALGATQQLAGLPRFREGAFHAAYPLAQVCLADPEIPVSVRLEAFNPLIPGDSAASGLPVAALRYVLRNDSDSPVEATLCATMENFIGHDGHEGTSVGNRCTWRSAGARGLFMDSTGVPAHDERSGSMALTTTARHGISHRSACADLSWGDSWLDLWDDLEQDGRLDERDQGTRQVPRCALAVSTIVPAHAERSVTFVLTWHFPNRQTWTAQRSEATRPWSDFPENYLGNWYCGQHADAWAVAVDVAARLNSLERDTLAFVGAVCAADLPVPVLDAALSNVSTLRSQTVFRTPDGLLFGWEGSSDHGGSCHGSCTHVWNYEHATAALFPDLARGMREVEFLHCTGDTGHMAFRCHLPLSRARDWATAAADGQMGCLLKLHREWRQSGDDAWLRKLWPAARKTLEFCWISGGWDADQDGVMEGCQHNTLDVEYYGPTGLMQFWYLGALRAAAVMARHLGETTFAAKCDDLTQRGAAWTDARLFNGEWYVQDMRPSQGALANGLRHESMGSANVIDPDFQLGAACLVDQLAGQVFASLEGLGPLADPNHLASAASAVWRYNHRGELHGHFNHLRTFALADEPALLMATWPQGGRPRRPVPYCNEVMTGFEYTAALALIVTGAPNDGIQAITDVRNRHDGRRRNPFNEPECGHHYARAMASWGAIAALTGLRWSAQNGALHLHRYATPTTGFFAVGCAWGTWQQKPVPGGTHIEITVLGGRLPLLCVVLGDQSQAADVVAGRVDVVVPSGG